MALPNPAPPLDVAPRLPQGEAADAVGALLRALLADAGGRVLAMQGQVATELKPDGTPITHADLAAEEILVAGLHAAFPDDRIVSEEGGGRTPDAVGATWVVDPIDGTSAYTEGLPHWGPTVARLVDGRVSCAALFLPRLAQYWFYDERIGAFLDGTPLPPLADRPVSRNTVAYVPSRLHRHMRLDWPGKTRNLGSLAAMLALVASGSAAVALVPPGWSPWDTACGLALIGAVGGRAATPAGTAPELNLQSGATSSSRRPGYAAGTPAAVEWLLEPGRIRPH
jgi:myo-inositol-1(or 4)-monophosphatase